MTTEADSHLIFQDVHVARDEVVTAARKYVGMPYDYKNTHVEWIDGKPVGRTNCLFLLLLVAEDVGLLPKGYVAGKKWIRRPREAGQKPLSRDATMWAILSANCDEVGKDRMLPGDIIVEKWTDMANTEEHTHLAICSSMMPWPFRSKIHAIDTDMSVRGAVEEVVMNALDWQKRIQSVWRIRGIGD